MIIVTNKRISFLNSEYFKILKSNINDKNNRLKISPIFFKNLINCSFIPKVYAVSKS